LGTPTTAIFNKRDYALRGYETGLQRLRGRRMGLAELEWRFPIALVERGAMIPVFPTGIHNIYGKVFYNIGDAWEENLESSDLLSGAGVEFNTEFIFAYMGLLDVRLGYAHGFDSDVGEEQFYFYLGGTF
ncbi:hypothetical protein, partial [Kaarinaea lacus]